ncbi:MAG: hypothetical protein R2724_34725 [Bryobacterales bacterium]
MVRWTVVGALALAGCSGGEPHECDNGEPTCDSSLVVSLPDPRVDFDMHLADDVGMDLQFHCPLPDPEADFGAYTISCGAGRVQVDTAPYFGDDVDVQLGAGQIETYTPRYSRGTDYCSNACTQGSIQL